MLPAETLPAGFGALGPYLAWALPTEPERYARRLASTMDEMQAFYDTAFPLLEPALTHLDKFSLAELPGPERTLLHLMQSLIMVSFPVEVWKQPRVPDSGAAYLDLVVEPRI
jgi:hypothetical protein